jgi:hypothetical protein
VVPLRATLRSGATTSVHQRGEFPRRERVAARVRTVEIDTLFAWTALSLGVPGRASLVSTVPQVSWR